MARSVLLAPAAAARRLDRPGFMGEDAAVALIAGAGRFLAAAGRGARKRSTMFEFSQEFVPACAIRPAMAME